MILQILGLAVIVIATYHIAKTAKEYGRNSALWIFMALAVGFGFQWILPVVLGIVLAIVYLALGTPQQELQSALSTPAAILTFLCLGLSLVGLLVLLKLVSRVPDEPEVMPVPPPPTFNQPDIDQ
jgi:uncharacterized membrane protein